MKTNTVNNTKKKELKFICPYCNKCVPIDHFARYHLKENERKEYIFTVPCFLPSSKHITENTKQEWEKMVVKSAKESIKQTISPIFTSTVEIYFPDYRKRSYSNYTISADKLIFQPLIDKKLIDNKWKISPSIVFCYEADKRELTRVRICGIIKSKIDWAKLD